MVVSTEKVAFSAEKPTFSRGQKHVNLLSTYVNLKKVANPLYIGVLST